ncbi:MAG: DUF4890 domain-containing protein [Bacteroides sp.]
MKKISYLFVLLMMVGSVAFAQKDQKTPRAKKVDPKVRVERMTERMAKEYALTDKQKEQLFEANRALVEKMDQYQVSSRMHKKGAGLQGKDSIAAKKQMCCKAKRLSKEERMKRREELKKVHEAYDAQLKSIMTKDQYEALTKKQAERREENRKR